MTTTEASAAAETLRAEITIPQATAALLARSAGELELARELFPAALQSLQMAELAGQHLTGLRQRRDALKGLKDRLTEPARSIIRTALEWFQPGIKANEEADAYISGLLSNWSIEQTRIAEAARRRAEAEAREKRLAEERAAAAERARLEEEARQRAQEAARAALAAQATKTAQAEAEAARARADADAASLAADRAAGEQMALASAPLELGPAPQEPPKVAGGVAMSDHWVPELDGPESAVLAAIVRAAFGLERNAALARPELLAYVSLDLVAIRRAVTAQKSLCNIPGVRAVNKPTPRRGRA